MTLHYDDYEYDLDDREAIDYIRRIYSDEEILTEYLTSILPTAPEDIKKAFAEAGYDGKSVESLFKSLDDYDIDELIDEILPDMFDEGMYEDILMDYFAEDARAEDAQYKEYAKDPYAYNGVSRSDFY